MIPATVGGTRSFVASKVSLSSVSTDLTRANAPSKRRLRRRAEAAGKSL